MTAQQTPEQPRPGASPGGNMIGMPEGPSRRSEVLSWTYLFLWSGFIFLSVPFVRGLVNYVREHWSSELFTYGVTAGVILVLAWAVALLLKQPRKPLACYAWLVGIAGIVIYQTFELKAGSPVEAVHFLQYGILSILLFRAFAHRIRDYSIYAVATIVGTVIGMVDEAFQWMVPDRHFTLEDIWLNFTAVALVQVALAAGIRPRTISGWPDGAGLRRLCRLGAFIPGLLGLFYLNSPDLVVWYTARVPLLDFIDERDTMVQYGYLHGDDANGWFRSRLSVEELRSLSRDRAEEGARILDRYRDRERYREFHDVYTPINDPFLHEARVHLFRRDIYLERARDAEEDEKGLLFAVAYWENRILEDYFGELLNASSYSWSDELKAEVAEQARTDQPYESKVSSRLITDFSRWQIFSFYLSAVVGLLLLGSYFGRRAPG